jgi:arylsulfatase A-like enzyme
LIIVTADHGEEFGEHGHLLHGISLYEPAIRVPLLVVGRGVAANQIVRQPVSLLDVAPSVLELIGLPAESSFEGRSLVPLLRGESPAPNPHGVVSELERVSERGAETRVHSRAVLDGANKAIMTPAGGLELYDLTTDPRERWPLAGSRAVEVASPLAPLAAEHVALAAHSRGAAQSQSAVLDDATKEKLRALGYHQ